LKLLSREDRDFSLTPTTESQKPLTARSTNVTTMSDP
jgi:hypothetical protein